MAGEESRSTGGVQSIDRVFELIELLSQHPKGLRLMELVEKTGLHKSTAHRLLATLTARGYVVQEGENKRYRLTLRLFELSGRIVDEMDVLEVARESLEQLRDQCREAVHLVVREGSGIVYIHKSESLTSGMRMFSRVGMRRPMYCTGVGKAILATMTTQEIEQVWNTSKIKPYTQHTITTLPGLLAELERVRVLGYAMDNEENELGVRCIAASVPDYSGQSVAAFSVSAPIVRMSDQRIADLVPLLLATRQKIGDGLGYRPRG